MVRQATDELLDRSAYDAPDLECDIVMKGGITSGVVYPLAVCELARRYRLVSVGGASAGAIAASAAAAAEHGRHSESGGFTTLAALPPRLASVLSDLFQPQARTRHVFRLLLASIAKPTERRGKLLKPLRIAWRFLVALLCSRRYLPLGLLPLAVVAAIGLAFEWDALDGWRLLGFALWLIVCLVALVAGGAIAIALAAGRAIAGICFGLVTGTGPSCKRRSATVEPLGDWLHGVINAAAGRGPTESPVTFRELARGRDGDSHAVELVVMTTCLTQIRSYRIPNDFGLGSDLRERWFFDEGELRKVLPAAVVDHLVSADHAPPSPPPQTSGGKEWAWLRSALAPLKPLPDPADWPIVMSARMSLSFPVLLSAVPLWKVDWSLAANGEAMTAWRQDPGSELKPRADRCWFSDGGITSNFPLHFFDSLLPRRPTFGINLRGFHPNRTRVGAPDVSEAEKVYRPPHNSGGMDEWWSRFDEAKGGLGRVVAFLGAIQTTGLNWGDNEQMKVPGYRDRVAHISHSDDEGGMNLDMPPDHVARLSERGRIAGELLRDAFTTPATPERATDWRNHKWVRLRTSSALLDEALRSLMAAYDETNATGVESYRELLRLDRGEQPSYKVTNAQRELVRQLVEDGLLPTAATLGAARSADANVAPERDSPSPLPEFRVMPGHRPRRDRG